MYLCNTFFTAKYTVLVYYHLSAKATGVDFLSAPKACSFSHFPRPSQLPFPMRTHPKTSEGCVSFGKVIGPYAPEFIVVPWMHYEVLAF